MRFHVIAKSEKDHDTILGRTRLIERGEKMSCFAVFEVKMESLLLSENSTSMTAASRVV